MGETSSLNPVGPLSNTAPPPAILTGAAGSSAEASRADHTHATKVQRVVRTTDGNGNITWVFAQPFAGLPAVTALANTTGQPIAISITAKTTTSVTINCRQSSPLPATLLSLTALLNLNIFANPAAGVSVDIFAAEVTQ